MEWETSWSQMIALELGRLGHDLRLIDFTRETSPDLGATKEPRLKELIALGATFSRLPPYSLKAIAPVLGSLQLRKVLRGCRPDIVLALYSGVYGMVAYLSGFRPYAVFAMGSDVLLLRSAISKKITETVFRNAAYVCANGQFLAKKGSEIGSGIHVEPLLHGIPVDEFAIPENEPPTSFLCNRTFAPLYNHEYIVEALAQISTNRPFTFEFAGLGPTLGSVQRHVQAVVPDDIKRHVKFIGQLTSQGVKQSLLRSRFFVSMARSDGTATSLLEALASGLYPILSDIPQNREWIDPAQGNGMLVPLNDSSRLTQAFQKAIEQPEIWRLHASYNRTQVIERANLKRNAQILLARLASAISKSPRKS
jgi:glycosyltransferase involved in cell wall biosynthesis